MCNPSFKGDRELRMVGAIKSPLGCHRKHQTQGQERRCLKGIGHVGREEPQLPSSGLCAPAYMHAHTLPWGGSNPEPGQAGQSLSVLTLDVYGD